MDYRLKRRTFLGASFGAGLSIAGLNSCANQAQTGGEGAAGSGGRLVAATYQGTWEDAHRKILVSAFQKATGADVTLVPMFAVDQAARLQAAGASNSPFDVAILDPGSLITVPKEELLQALNECCINEGVDAIDC